jgi:hypothetical protein
MNNDTSINATAVKTVAQDLVDDAALVHAIVAAVKKSGAPGLAPLAPGLIADVKAALPAVKAGYKTTEFWLTGGVVLGNGLYTLFTGHVLPIDLNVVLGGLVAIYTTARALVKKPAARPASAPAN